MRRIGVSILALTVIIGWGPATAAPGDAHPDSGAFEAAGTVKSGLLGHVATTLPDGRVLIVGGEGRRELVATAELWDPLSGARRATARPRAIARGGSWAAELPSPWCC